MIVKPSRREAGLDSLTPQAAQDAMDTTISRKGTFEFNPKWKS